jgi:cellulose synthase/poly-beta-1,6-N-acetylglucosamine synthase-like glycosyltransferase
MHQINIIAAVVAGVLGYFPGGLWYSKAMFLRRWAREMGLDIDNPPGGKRDHGPKIALGVATSIVAAITFALIAGPAPGLCHALLLAVAIAGLISAAFAIQYVFEDRSLAFWAINAGYHLVQFVIFGLVIALWP